MADSATNTNLMTIYVHAKAFERTYDRYKAIQKSTRREKDMSNTETNILHIMKSNVTTSQICFVRLLRIQSTFEG